MLEAIHRFGCENLPIAMDNFQLIIKAGIIIVTTMDRRIYSEEAIHKDPSLLTYLENQMQATHNESKFKSQFEQFSYDNAITITEATGSRGAHHRRNG